MTMTAPSTYWSPFVMNSVLATSNIRIVTILQEAGSVNIETSESQAIHFIDGQCLCEEKATITALEIVAKKTVYTYVSNSTTVHNNT